MFLDEAIAAARKTASEMKEWLPASALECLARKAGPLPDFKSALKRNGGRVRVIAEVKRMSPSAGVISSAASAGPLASRYERAGACAVSVITCEYKFGGHIADLEEARAGCGLPLLRKDFLVEPYQVLESRAFGASAVLLIADALEAREIRSLASYARELGMEALVEAHSRESLEKALDSGAEIIGINNRDLATLEVDTDTTSRLLPFVPPGHVVVSESGIDTAEAARRMEESGVDAILVGEALMRAPDPGRKIKELLGEVSESCG